MGEFKEGPKIKRLVLMRVLGLLISAKCLLTLEEGGDFARRFACKRGLRSMGEAAVMTVDRLPGFSLVLPKRVVMAMVVKVWGRRLTFRMKKIRPMMRVTNGPSAWHQS